MDQTFHNMHKLSTAKRTELKSKLESAGQHFCVEKSSSSRSKCRGCGKMISKGEVRFRHIVCSARCFRKKQTGIDDSCGRWHVSCLIKSQKDKMERFVYTNPKWENIAKPTQLAGFETLTEQDQKFLLDTLEKFKE
jgi:hypothetical protein